MKIVVEYEVDGQRQDETFEGDSAMGDAKDDILQSLLTGYLPVKIVLYEGETEIPLFCQWDVNLVTENAFARS
jgi:hypothetical protein